MGTKTALMIFAAAALFATLCAPARAIDANPRTVCTFQMVIAVTGTAVVFPFCEVVIGATCTAKAANNAAGMFWGYGSAITRTYDGTGNGDVVIPGDKFALAWQGNLNKLYVNGTAGDILSCHAN